MEVTASQRIIMTTELDNTHKTKRMALNTQRSLQCLILTKNPSGRDTHGPGMTATPSSLQLPPVDLIHWLELTPKATSSSKEGCEL